MSIRSLFNKGGPDLRVCTARAMCTHGQTSHIWDPTALSAGLPGSPKRPGDVALKCLNPNQIVKATIWFMDD